MVMYKATANGDVELTQEEEAAIIAERGVNNGIDKRKAKLKQRVAQIRYKKEIAGIVVNSISVSTDDTSQARISRTLSYLNRKPVSINFKDANGNFISVNAAQMTAIFDAVGDHVQSCFDAERAHCEAIDALTEQNIDFYDVSTNWP